MGAVGAEAFDLALRALDHGLKVGDELFVHGSVGAAKSIAGGGARSIENPEHRDVLVAAGLDAPRVPAIAIPVTEASHVERSFKQRCRRYGSSGLRATRRFSAK